MNSGEGCEGRLNRGGLTGGGGGHRLWVVGGAAWMDTHGLTP